MKIQQIIWPEDRIQHIAHGRKAAISKISTKMKKQQIPKTDSIEELARFWDAHDLTLLWLGLLNECCGRRPAAPPSPVRGTFPHVRMGHVFMGSLASFPLLRTSVPPLPYGC